MLDITLLRKDLDAVIERLSARKNPQPFLDVARFSALETERKGVQTRTEELQARRNALSKQIGMAKGKGEDASALMAEVNGIADELKAGAERLDAIQLELNHLLMGVPNLPDASVPAGHDETGNVEVRRWGTPRAFDFEVRDHVDLGAPLGLDFETGAKLCLQRFESRARYWLYAARIGAELLLRLGKYAEAQQMYEAIVAAKTVPWAKLGVARAQLAGGSQASARRTLEDLVGELPGYADSHDLLGHLQMEQGDLAQALQTYQTATTLTPGCLLRLQRCGSLAYYAGQREQAMELLERATAQGLRSKLFDMLSLMLVGFMRFDRGERKALNYAFDALNAAIWRLPPSKRLQRFERAFAALQALMDRQLPQAQAIAQELDGQADQGDFDLEAATLLVALWMRLVRQGLPWDVARPALERLGLRYCTSKASTEVLVASTDGDEQAEPLLRDCHQRIFGIAETAVRHSIRSNAVAAVELLLQQGESTRNAKLIDMAALVLKRHAAKFDDPAHYEQQALTLQERYVLPMGWRGLLRGRDSGAVALRVQAEPATLSLPTAPNGSQG